jgi:glycosyltransferase involved in cell wall biosynthesis
VALAVHDPDLQRLNVIQTLASLDRQGGGMPRAVIQLADALADEGSATAVVCLSPAVGIATIAPARAALLRARALRLQGHALWSDELASMIAGRIASPGKAVIHDNGLWGYLNWEAARAAARARVPLVLSPHGMLAPWAMAYKPLRKRIALAAYQRGLLEQVQLFVVSSPGEAANVRQAGLRQPIAVVPPGVDIPEASVRVSGTPEFRRALFLSRVHPIKGLVPFIHAWHALQPAGWRVTIAGPDEVGHRAEIEQLVAQLGLRSAFEFVGEADDAQKRELFQSADLFVLPTHTENFGLVVAEALSHNLPVLTTHGAPWAVLEKIGAGWWVEPGTEGLRDGLRAALATSPEQRLAMGQVGRRYVEEHLSWPSAAKRTRESYEWLLGWRSQRPGHVQID